VVPKSDEPAAAAAPAYDFSEGLLIHEVSAPAAAGAAAAAAGAAPAAAPLPTFKDETRQGGWSLRASTRPTSNRRPDSARLHEVLH